HGLMHRASISQLAPLENIQHDGARGRSAQLSQAANVRDSVECRAADVFSERHLARCPKASGDYALSPVPSPAGKASLFAPGDGARSASCSLAWTSKTRSRCVSSSTVLAGLERPYKTKREPRSRAILRPSTSEAIPELSTYFTPVMLTKSWTTPRSVKRRISTLRISGELKRVMSPTRSRIVASPCWRVE